MAISGRNIIMMDPSTQQQQVSSRLPPGVENVYVTYSYYGRPRIMLTLDPNARRKLMMFAVILLVFGPLIITFTTVCVAMKHYYLAYGYAAGILVSIFISTHVFLSFLPRDAYA